VDSSCIASDTSASCSKDGAGVEIYDVEVLVQLQLLSFWCSLTVQT